MLRSFICSLLLVLLLLPTDLLGRHIIGGVITYLNLGGGNYRFVMKMYRDCNCVDCADFDAVASIGVAYAMSSDVSSFVYLVFWGKD